MTDDEPFWRPANLIATWFGVGLLPKAPGTWGSLSALPFAWLIASYGGQLWLFVAAGILFAVGCIAAQGYGSANGSADAPEIVVDEVAGQWLTLAVVPPELFLYLAGFILFRIADIVKPWPASLVDRKMKSGFGVMLDDVVAAAYASIFLLMGLHISSFT
jgi:phosphatidylglycerophosphatase A